MLDAFEGRLFYTLEHMKGVEILPFDLDTDTALRYAYVRECDFVFHLAGVNRPNGSKAPILITLIRILDRGQISVNISKHSITNGNHWHRTKNEKFIVVSGRSVIRFRKVNEKKVLECFVNGDTITVVDSPTGYTHNIENLGDTDMVTVMWASECFDPDHLDTYFLPI